MGGRGVFLIASGANWLGAGTLADSEEDGTVLGLDEMITEGEAGVGFSCTFSFIAEEGFCRGSSETFI